MRKSSSGMKMSTFSALIYHLLNYFAFAVKYIRTGLGQPAMPVQRFVTGSVTFSLAYFSYHWPMLLLAKVLLFLIDGISVLTKFSFQGIYFLFSGITFTGFVVFFLILPETKNKKIEEIEEVLRGPWFSCGKTPAR